MESKSLYSDDDDYNMFDGEVDRFDFSFERQQIYRKHRIKASFPAHDLRGDMSIVAMRFFELHPESGIHSRIKFSVNSQNSELQNNS